MKKHILLLLVSLLSVTAFAQKPVKSELKAMQAFLSQPAVEAASNAAAL
ncbi:MAG: hypothetical protein HDS66_06825, partial [Bacteroidales bacterium]|nr:hypothetical protein [Bacteroidales bacterium]